MKQHVLTVKANELKKGQTIKVWGKTWKVLGQSEKDVFFMNTRSRKYPAYCWKNSQGEIYLGDMTRMTISIDRLNRVYGFDQPLASGKGWMVANV